MWTDEEEYLEDESEEWIPPYYCDEPGAGRRLRELERQEAAEWEESWSERKIRLQKEEEEDRRAGRI